MSSYAALYNALQGVEAAKARLDVDRSVLDELARLLVIKGLSDHYDIRLLHKHFKINDNERVVTFEGKSCKVSTPYSPQDTLPTVVVQEHGIELPSEDGVIFASDFLIDETQAIPYEFTYGSSASTNAPLDQAFLRDWTTILRARNMDGLLGLAVRDGVEIGGYEESDSASRWSKVTYEENPMPPGNGIDFITTSWRIFDSESGLVELKQCSYCTSLQRHGKSTSCTTDSL